MTTRYPAFADDILALFAEREAHVVDIPIIQPADPFLDMAGEDLRRRIFLTENDTGETLCLRPEFTIPVCRDHIARDAATPRRYAYLGEVFRQRREGGTEFFQAGIEDLGEPDHAAADARSLADASALLQRVLPQHRHDITLGDQAVFEAVLAALGLPRGWQKRLARSFGSLDMLAGALSDLADPQAVSTGLPPNMAGLVADGDSEALTTQIGSAMEKAGISPSAGRTPEEIARRLIEKAELVKVRLPDAALTALKEFLAIRTPLDRAVDHLSSFATAAGVSLEEALESLAARTAQISREGLPAEDIHYDAAFGRPLDYYTGLVFEISVPQGPRPLVGGGRYDRLLTLLGAEAPIPGVGFSVWLDRIEALRGDGS